MIGNDPPSVSSLPAGRTAILNARLATLRRFNKTDADRLAGAEQSLLHGLDPLLQKIGLPPGGFNPTETNEVRRAAAKLAQSLEEAEPRMN